MIEAGKKIKSYTHGIRFEQFVADAKTCDAVVRNFEIIGEAANALPDSFTTAHPEIHWRRVVGLRNRLIHGYFGVDYSIVWNIITQFLDGFITELEKLRFDGE
jgi:uncharacterized protein with HEPN domain